MTQAILGLDIGRDALKAVSVASGMRVTAADTVEWTDAEAPDAALLTLAGRITASSFRVVLSLPLTEVMLRRVALPFRDEGRIKKALPFALEPLLPMPIEEVAFDYLRLPQGDLLVAAVDRKRLADWTQSARKVFGPVMAVDVAGALELAAAGRMLELKPFGMLLDVGRQSTAVVFFEAGLPVAMRTLAFGGRRITQALAEDLTCGEEEAEAHKIGGRFPQSDGQVQAACREFCAELESTIESLNLSGDETLKPQQILLSGGGSLFLPLQDELARAFGVSPDMLDLPGAKGAQSAAKLPGAFLPQRMNTAFAAATRAFGTRRSFNFYRDEAASLNPFAVFRGRLRRFAIAAAVIVGLAAGNIYLSHRVRQAEADALKTRISALFKKNMGAAAVMVDPPGQLKAKLAENEKAYGLSSGAADLTMAGLLRELSLRIPPEADLTLSDLYCENKSVLIKGQAASMDVVAAAAAELAKSPSFAAVTPGSTSMSSDKTKVNFDLRLEMK